MVNYWPSAHTVETWEGFLASGAQVEGYTSQKKSRVERMQPGDFMIFYIIREKKFAGYARICSGCYYDETPRFAGDHYPFRVKVEIMKSLEYADWIPFDDIKNELHFYQDYGKSYGLYFKTEPSPFDAADGKHIINKINQINP